MISDNQEAKTKHPWAFFGEVRGGKAFLVNLFASFIACFSEPTFGFDYNSLRLFLTFWLVFLVLNYGGSILKKIFASRKKLGYRARIIARPSNLIFLVGSVIFARIAQIEPALILGAVIAVEAGSSAIGKSVKLAARASIIGSLYMMFSGLLAWVLFSLLNSPFISAAINGLKSTQGNPSLGIFVENVQVIFTEFFSVMTISALSALPLSLLPLAFLEGINIWRWSKIAWGITYTLASILYAFVLVRIPDSWGQIDFSIFSWVGIYFFYVLIALAIWAYFRFWNTRTARDM